MTIYIDNDYKCHVSDPDGTMTAVETDAFDGKCPAYIEGYRYIPAGATWTRPDGVVFHGEMIFPWKDWRELDAAQRGYEWEQLVSVDIASLSGSYYFQFIAGISKVTVHEVYLA